MGLKPIYLDYINECIENALGGISGKRMLELGNQEIVEGGGTIPERTGKKYYENRGGLHTSFDLNGLDGALKIDLSKPITDSRWVGYFDIVTNSGTSEHVEPYQAQYECFMNMHNCLKKGGIAIHLVPGIEELEAHGSWKRHCNNYYSMEFFKMLAINNNYKLISPKIIDSMISVCLQKEEDNTFMKDREEFLKYITRKRGGKIFLGINDLLLPPFLRPMVRLILDVTRPARSYLLNIVKKHRI